MALNRFLSSETGSVKVDVTNPVLKVDASATVGDLNVEAGYDFGQGNIGVKTIRTVLATDHSDTRTNTQRLANEVVSLGIGATGNGTQRVVLATDDVNASAINTASTTLATTVQAVSNPSLRAELVYGDGDPMDKDFGIVSEGTLRVCIGDDDTNMTSINEHLRIQTEDIAGDPFGVYFRSASTGFTPIRMTGTRTGVGTSFSSISKGFPTTFAEFRNTSFSAYVVSTDTGDDSTASGSNAGADSVQVIGIGTTGQRLDSGTILLSGQNEILALSDCVAVSSLTVVAQNVHNTAQPRANLGVISVWRGSAHTNGVPTSASQVQCQIPIGDGIADVHQFGVPDTITAYPVELTVCASAQCRIRLEWLKVPGHVNAASISVVMAEMSLPAGCSNIPLSSTVGYSKGMFRFKARAESGTVDIGFNLSMFEK